MATIGTVTTIVTAYGKPGCNTCAHYRSVLDSAGVSYDWVDISGGPIAVAGVGEVDGPTIVFTPPTGEPVALSRPTDDELRRWLERFELVDRTIHLDEAADHNSGRYVLPLLGGDAFITYVDRPDGTRHITYSEVPVSRRGQGLGAELSHKTLDALVAAEQPATFGCGYVAAVANRYTPWRDFISENAG